VPTKVPTGEFAGRSVSLIWILVGASSSRSATVTNSADFEIANGNELKTKRAFKTVGNKSVVTITASDGTRSIDKTFAIKVVASSQVRPPAITNTDAIDKDGIVDLDIGRGFIV
jgi:hypothetical protein